MKDQEHTVIDLEVFDFSKVKIAFFAAGSEIAKIQFSRENNCY